VYSVWLTIVDVARLDSAFCINGVRAGFLDAAYKAGVPLHYKKDISSRQLICEAINVWIMTKNASVPGIFITSAFIRDQERTKEYFRMHGESLRWAECCFSPTYRQWPCSEDIQPIAITILKHCPRLVRFGGYGFQDEKILMTLATFCPLLEDIAIDGYGCTSDALLALSQGCRKLTRLHLTSSGATEDCLVALVRSNPSLVTLIAHCKGVTHRLFCELAMSCRNLEIVVVGEARVTAVAIHLLLQQCQSLRELDLMACHIEESTDELAMMVQSTSLRELTLIDTIIDDSHLLGLLQVCPRVTNLTLRECLELEQLNDLQFGTLCPCLQELCLHYNPTVLDDAAVRNIAEHCHQLRVLQIPDSHDVSDAALTALVMACPLLEELDIGGCMDVTDRFLFAIAEHGSSLTSLNAIGCPRITDEGLEMLRQRCPNLEDVQTD
jgi:hypothetical protein